MVMKRDLSNENHLDRLGLELLKAAALSETEIEATASSGELFSRVRSRIINESVARRGHSARVVLARRVLLVASAAIVAVAGIVAASTLIRRGTTGRNIAVRVERPAAERNVASTPTPVLADRDVTPEPRPEMVSVDDDGPRIEKAVAYRRMPERRPVRNTQPQVENPMEFYALADLHPSEETTRQGRVVRVDLPKASLVALGINIPLDSDKQLYQTDLLVGPDGVPRAIRLVE